MLPTITPHGDIVVSCLGRRLVPLEKLLVHGFPVHKMVFPDGITDAMMEELGGNTMHLMCVGAALLIATSIVDWSHPAAALGKRPFAQEALPVKRQANRRHLSAKQGTAAKPVTRSRPGAQGRSQPSWASVPGPHPLKAKAGRPRSAPSTTVRPQVRRGALRPACAKRKSKAAKPAAKERRGCWG